MSVRPAAKAGAVRSQGFSASGGRPTENRGEEEADAHGIRDVGDLRISQPEPTQPIDVLLPDRRRVSRGGRREPEDRSINHVQG